MGLRLIAIAAAAKSLQSCPTLCDPIDASPPVSPVPGILQARTLEWVAISFSSTWKGKVKVKSFSHVWLFVTPWTAAHQAPPSIGFSRQEYWSGVPLPSLVLNKSSWILIYTASFSKWLCVKCLRIFSEMLPRIHTRLGSREASKESGAKNLELALSTKYQGPEEWLLKSGHCF